jgi:hypothetical protein
LIVLAVIFAFVWSAFDAQISSYEGGSYSGATLLFFIWGFAIANFMIDFTQKE